MWKRRVRRQVEVFENGAAGIALGDDRQDAHGTGAAVAADEYSPRTAIELDTIICHRWSDYSRCVPQAEQVHQAAPAVDHQRRCLDSKLAVPRQGRLLQCYSQLPRNQVKPDLC